MVIPPFFLLCPISWKIHFLFNKIEASLFGKSSRVGIHMMSATIDLIKVAQCKTKKNCQSCTYFCKSVSSCLYTHYTHTHTQNQPEMYLKPEERTWLVQCCLISISTLVLQITFSPLDILAVNCQTSHKDLVLLFSMNPEIDVGQIEGGFVLGMGCHLTEYSKFDPKTGILLTDGTWVSW